MLSRSTVKEHTGSFQSIPATAPTGLLCLQILLEQEESMSPSAAVLDLLIANDFTELENGLQRSHSKAEMISQALNRPLRYARFQTILSRATCVSHQDKSHSVMFEGDKFIVLKGDQDWIRIAMSGRIEVRPLPSKVTTAMIKSGKYSGGEIIYRTVTLDLSGFWKRKNEVEAMWAAQQQIPRMDPPSATNTPEYGHRPSVHEYQQLHVELPARVPDGPAVRKMPADDIVSQMKNTSLYDTQQPAKYPQPGDNNGHVFYDPHSHSPSPARFSTPYTKDKRYPVPSTYPVSDHHNSQGGIEVAKIPQYHHQRLHVDSVPGPYQ